MKKFIPTCITASNGVLGAVSLYAMAAGRFDAIAWFVSVSAFLDFLDGYLARKMNAETGTGLIADSLSDLVSFVCVPAFYAAAVYQKTPSPALAAGVFFYFFAGVTRLARYTFLKMKSTKNVHTSFIGCPVTAAALCVVWAIPIYHNEIFTAIFLSLCGYLMISDIEYPSLFVLLNTYGREIMSLVNMSLLAPFFVFYFRNTLCAVSCAYLLFFPVNHYWPSSFYGIRGMADRIHFLAKGSRETIVGCFIAAVMAMIFLPSWLKIAYGAFLISIVYFFRDPPRRAEYVNNRSVFSPADGRIVSICAIYDPAENKVFHRISIFLSLFDVHVTRAPAAARILRREYCFGSHQDARHPASVQNESCDYVMRLESGSKIFMRQIAGRFARRIKSYVNEGDSMAAADRIGVILFGSRVELMLPREVSLFVKVGDMVKAGITIMGKMDG